MNRQRIYDEIYVEVGKRRQKEARRDLVVKMLDLTTRSVHARGFIKIDEDRSNETIEFDVKLLVNLLKDEKEKLELELLEIYAYLDAEMIK